MRPVLSMLAALAAAFSAAGDGFTVDYRETPGPNLLRNADFSEIGPDGVPAGWYFDNCTRNELLLHGVAELDRGNAATITVADADTPELYGYWSQIVRLTEPGRYCFRFNIRTEDMSFAYWLSDNTGTNMVLKMFPSASGPASRAILEKFVPEDLLLTFSPDIWSPVTVEFDVAQPPGDGVFGVKAGAMAASAGWMAVDDAWFGRAETVLTARIAGAGAARLEVEQPGGMVAGCDLDSALSEQEVALTVPSRLAPSKWIVTDLHGNRNEIAATLRQ